MGSNWKMCTGIMETDFYFQKLHTLRQTSSVRSYQSRFELLRDLVITRHPHFEESYFVSCCIKGFNEEIQNVVQLFWPSSVKECFSIALLQEFVLSNAAKRNSESGVTPSEANLETITNAEVEAVTDVTLDVPDIVVENTVSSIDTPAVLVNSVEDVQHEQCLTTLVHSDFQDYDEDDEIAVRNKASITSDSGFALMSKYRHLSSLIVFPKSVKSLVLSLGLEVSDTLVRSKFVAIDHKIQGCPPPALIESVDHNGKSSDTLHLGNDMVKSNQTLLTFSHNKESEFDGKLNVPEKHSTALVVHSSPMAPTSEVVGFVYDSLGDPRKDFRFFLGYWHRPLYWHGFRNGRLLIRIREATNSDKGGHSH